MTPRFRHPLSDRDSALRTLLNVVAFVAAIFGYWWVLLVAAAIICVAYGGYEVIGAGLLFDVLFPSGAALLNHTPYMTTALILLLAALAWLLRLVLPRFGFAH